jgi:hypothetical protein
MAEIGLSAFSIFFTQSPSFLAHQRHLVEGHGRSNAQTLFGIARIATDNHIRALLDPVPPEQLFPLFGEIVSQLEEHGGLAALRRLGEHVLIALDGTEYHRSTKVRCPHCSTRRRPGQPTEFFHTVLCATLVAPATARSCHSRRNSSRPRTGMPSRIARAGRRGAGSPDTGRLTRG